MEVQNAINTAAIFQANSQPGINTRRQNDEAQVRPERSDRDGQRRGNFEQELIRFDEEQVSLLDQQNQRSQSTLYDEPSGKNRLAIQAYEGVGNIEQRASVQQVLGVDVFA